MGRYNIFQNIFFLPTKRWKNQRKKLHTNGSWELLFFPAALSTQNSPELDFRFINSFIQPYLLESLHLVYFCSTLVCSCCSVLISNRLVWWLASLIFWVWHLKILIKIVGPWNFLFWDQIKHMIGFLWLWSFKLYI